MSLFRSSQHLLVLPALFLAILLGLGLFSFASYSNERLSTKKNYLAFFIFFILISVWISPFLTGNLGWDYLKGMRGGNNVNTFQLSPGYKAILSKLNSEDDDFRVVYLPMTYSPYYLKTEYQEEGQGRDPLITFAIKPAVVAHAVSNYYSRQFAALLRDSIYKRGPAKSVSKFLKFANVQYIILRKDVRPNFGPFVHTWNHLQIYDNLREMENIELIKEDKYVSLWENQYFVPRIYAFPDKRGL